MDQSLQKLCGTTQEYITDIDVEFAHSAASATVLISASGQWWGMREFALLTGSVDTIADPGSDNPNIYSKYF
jgi:hypothetical protein